MGLWDAPHHLDLDVRPASAHRALTPVQHDRAPSARVDAGPSGVAGSAEEQQRMAPGLFTTLQSGARPGWWGKYAAIVVCLDLVVIAFALLVGNLVRFAGQYTSVAGQPNLSYSVFSVLLGTGWMVLLSGTRAYSKYSLGFGDMEYRRVVHATLWLFGALSTVAVVLQFDIARGFLAIVLPLGVFLLLLNRWCMRQFLVRRRMRGQMMDHALLVGSADAVRWTAERIRRTPGAGYAVDAVACGAGTRTVTLRDGHELANLGSVERTVEHMAATGLRTVIVADEVPADHRFLRRLAWQLEDTAVQLVITSRLTDIAGPRIHWRPVEGMPLMTVDTPRYSGVRYVLKRVFDLSIAAVVLVIVSPLFALTAVAIKAEDRGPVFFRQRRVGVDGEEFTMLKFRSMRVGADHDRRRLAGSNEASGPLFKLRRDPRVTGVGRWTRKWSIDELPQLWNVLRGDMSLVGPRPQLPEEVASLAPHQRRRLRVKPGITGPWQVGGRSNLSADESVRLDLTYVETWSLVGDLIILLKTVKAVLTRDGAY